MHFRTGKNPNGPKKQRRLYIITVFFLFTFMCIAFSLRVNGRHEVAVIYRDEYIGLNVSDNTAPLSQQKDCFKEENYNTEYKNTNKHSKT